MIINVNKKNNKYLDKINEAYDYAIKFLKLPCKELEVNLKFVSKGQIRKLNRAFRENDKVTDVLSFPSFQILAGDVLDVEDENVNEIINTLSKNCFDEETGEVKFNASKFNDNVENTLYRNDIMISRKPEIRTGEYWNQTKSKKGNKGITLKKNMPTEIYGSYTSVNPAYAIMVKITKGNKMTQKLVGYPIFLVNNKNNQLEVNYYQRLLGLSENDKYEFISKPILTTNIVHIF